MLIFAIAAATSISGAATVVDGDTLRMGGQHVRLFGVDAPELRQRCGTEPRRIKCGEQSAEWLRQRIRGRQVRCTQVDTDRYKRIVAICTFAGLDLGDALVRAGWATAYRRYSVRYVRAEAAAKSARRGIWATSFQAPALYREQKRRSSGSRPPNPSCAIKGNISSKGARIFHLPGSRDYDAVKIDVGKGERWFCSVREAAAAGWRARR